MSQARDLLVADFGLRGYGEMLEIQRAAARARITGEIDQDLLIIVQHPPVVTMGRSSKGEHLLANPGQLRERGVDVFEVERGGDITFHGPGQLVGYPIVDLKRHKQDLHWYLRQVEEALIRALGAVGIPAERFPKYTGVWTENRKIASIGVHARDWVTWHGFALNVSTELSYFELIVPCGIPAVTMTSVNQELRREVEVDEIRGHVSEAFGTVFDLYPRSIDAALLEARLAAVPAGA